MQIDYSARENRRTDVLNLNLYNYNHLIEKIEGTVVDIYGNILDINRNIIRMPEVDTIDTKDNTTSAENCLRRMYGYLRRSVKYHFEINSRKEISGTEPSLVRPGYNAKDLSRWYVDIDGEGLTKINIPASSETGNIPVLSRYITSRDEESKNAGSFRDSDHRDIRIMQFGAKDADGNFSGQQIDNSEYIPDVKKINSEASVLKVVSGTAHHDLVNIAKSIFTKGSGKLGDPKASGGNVVNPLIDKINNIIPPLNSAKIYDPRSNSSVNAGGRSLHVNLDGSIEMSVGADTADKKSVMLDLAGGIISHYGRDKNGRSIISQTDGDVIIQIGDKGVVDDRFSSDKTTTDDRPGRIEIHLNRPGGTSQRIIVDERGITIDVIGNGVIRSSGDLTISAGGKLLLDGERIFMYGSYDNSVSGTRAITGGERNIARKGTVI